MQYAASPPELQADAESFVALPKKRAAAWASRRFNSEAKTRPAAAYCGTVPSRPTLMRAASNVPSGFLVAASTVKAAPGLRSALLPIS